MIFKKVSLLLALVLAIGLGAYARATTTEPDINAAPVAENLEFTTYKNVPVTGMLQAVDPEGDMLEFQIIDQPNKGTAESASDGSFTYTPKEGKKGKDTFTYVAVDAIGNISQEAKVIIHIEKQTTKITYSDIEGHGAAYAALKLAENDVFVGEKLGDSYFFNPDATVSRGDFLAMCMKMAKAELLTDITRTGFADDGEISLWLKPYVTTALLNGAIQGYKNETGALVFNPNAPVTLAQASVILNSVMELTDVTVSGNVLDDELAPSWAAQAAANLSACQLIPSTAVSIYDKVLSRAEAAEMLTAAMAILEERDSGSLLSWAF